MKRYLKFLSQLTLISTFSLTTIACTGRVINGGDLDPGKPIDPVKKDLKYYQNLIKENEEYINDCQAWIKDINHELEHGDTSKEEAREAIDQINAEIAFFKTEINEDQYQILLIEGDGKITIEQAPAAISFLQEKIENLKQELAIKAKYPDDYSPEELKQIEKNISETELIVKDLNEILEIGEKEDAQYNFK